MKLKKKINLKELKTKDVTQAYVKWMNDRKILKFTEIYKKQNLKSIKKYVSEKKKSKNEFLYGIYLNSKKNKKKMHIGNIKLGPINFKHKFSEISYLIGNKKNWNQGYGSEAIRQLVIIAKKRFKLKKLQAGFNALNKSSKKVLLKKILLYTDQMLKKEMYQLKKCIKILI